LQTADSNSIANATIDSSRKEKVPQQQDQDIGSPTSNLVVKVTQQPAISLSHWGYVLKLKSGTRAGGFVWKYSPLLTCFSGNLVWHAATTIAVVIPCKGTLDDRPPSLLPFPINDSGQPLLSPESTLPHTGEVPIEEDSEEAVLAGQNTGWPAVNGGHPAHSCFPWSCPFFFLSPFQALRPASFLHIYLL